MIMENDTRPTDSEIKHVIFDKCLLDKDGETTIKDTAGVFYTDHCIRHKKQSMRYDEKLFKEAFIMGMRVFNIMVTMDEGESKDD